MTRRIVKVRTMLDGERLESVEHAEEVAIEQAVAELEDDTPADAQSAENIHDALSRLDELKKAGMIRKIS